VLAAQYNEQINFTKSQVQTIAIRHAILTSSLATSTLNLTTNNILKSRDMYMCNTLLFLNKGRASCFDSTTIQRGTVRFNSPRQVIVPRANFTCSGRITGIITSMHRVTSGTIAPYLEVWHPPVPDIGIFDKVGEVQLVESEVVQVGHEISTAYWIVDITLNDDNRIEFEAGDVIGYYQPSDSRYQVWSIETTGFTAYNSQVDPPVNRSNLVTYGIANNRQPLVQLIVGMSIITRYMCYKRTVDTFT